MSIYENLRIEINNYKTVYIRFNLIEGFSLETIYPGNVIFSWNKC